MICLAIDASTKSSGIAIFEEQELKHYKCITASSTNLYNRIDKMIEELDKVIKKKSGICFDKASLFCALCRINHIESKLVIGKVANKYNHAWCQIKIDNIWRTVDPTFGRKYKLEDYKIERTC